MDDDSLGCGGFAIVGGIIALIVGGIILAVGWLGGYETTGPAQACVIYNGGLFDKHDQRQTIAASSGRTWTGWWSDGCRMYPNHDSPRHYVITSDAGHGDRPGVDFVRVPTSDGKQITLNAKITFYDVFTGNKDTPDPGLGIPKGKCFGGRAEQCDSVLSKFDATYGNRTYPVPGESKSLHVWEGDEGFGAFLDTHFRPVVNNAIRETVASIPCADLVSSCAYVATGGKAQNININNGAVNNQSLAKVQEAIARALNEDLARNLGYPYFNRFQVIVSDVQLPKKVQDSIDDTQASFASVQKSQANLQKAEINLKVNRKKQKGYRTCPACAVQDDLAAIPENVNAISFGGNGAITLNGK